MSSMSDYQSSNSCADKETWTHLHFSCCIRLELLYLPMRLFGILESPTALWTGRVSTVFRVYSFALLLVTMGGCSIGIHYLFDTTNDPFIFGDIHQGPNYARIVYEMVILAAACTRLVCFVILNFRMATISAAIQNVSSEYGASGENSVFCFWFICGCVRFFNGHLCVCGFLLYGKNPIIGHIDYVWKKNVFLLMHKVFTVQRW